MYLRVGRMLGQVIYKLRHNELKESSIASPFDSLAGYANKVWMTLNHQNEVKADTIYIAYMDRPHP